MDQAELPQIRKFLKKYAYAALILLLGIVLMMFPGTGSRSETHIRQENAVPEKNDKLLQDELGDILGQMAGAGCVRVLLTVSEGEKTYYQTDQNSTGTDTVILSDSTRGQNGLIQKVDPPRYLGAVVICQGADNPTVRLAITQAVSNATGLGFDKISILKMK